LKALVQILVEALVDEPSLVSIDERVEGEETLLDVSVAPTDRGKVIGKRGRTAEALRTVVDAVADRQGILCSLEIVD
jgi:predicted RNA-binding protein YlqC (UPF0109 family)